MPSYAESETNKAFIAQFPKNFIANAAYFIINMIIGILLVPYFISTLGIAAYGIIPLATSITGYVGYVIGSINSAVSRYLTVDLHKEDYVAANRTFNTAVFGLSAVILLMTPVTIIISYFIPRIFNIPVGQENDAILLFLGVFAAFMIRSWYGNFTVQLFAYNRLDYQNIVNIISILVQTGLIILLFKLYGPSLAFVGIAIMVGAISASFVALILSKRVCPHLKISIHSIDKSRLKDLSTMSWWSLVNNIGTVLFLQIDLVVVNLLFGATPTGQYAVALQVAVLLRSVVNTISGVLTPMTFTYYAKGQVNSLIKMMKSAVKLVGLLIAFPIGLLCGFAPQILTVWVGSQYVSLAPLVILMTLHLTINLAVIPLFSINVAYNKIRLPGMVTFLMGGLNVVLAISLPLVAGWGFYGVAAAGAIVLTLKNAIFTPWYASKVMGINALTFIEPVLPGIIVTIVLAMLCYLIGIFVPITSFMALLLIGSILGIVYLIFIWKFSLSMFERGLFSTYVPERLRRVII
ncbi:MAG: oligosaccharide flippase family protein [Dehalobacter sp.]|nr:oligosaccharide flippase family protein [Dehalobacter sp.]